MQALIEMIIGFVALLAAAAMSQFGLQLDAPDKNKREIHRVRDCSRWSRGRPDKKASRIRELQWRAVHVAVRSQSSLQSNRIALHIPPRRWIVIREVVVVQPNHRIVLLSWKTEIVLEHAHT